MKEASKLNLIWLCEPLENQLTQDYEQKYFPLFAYQSMDFDLEQVTYDGIFFPSKKAIQSLGEKVDLRGLKLPMIVAGRSSGEYLLNKYGLRPSLVGQGTSRDYLPKLSSQGLKIQSLLVPIQAGLQGKYQNMALPYKVIEVPVYRQILQPAQVQACLDYLKACPKPCWLMVTAPGQWQAIQAGLSSLSVEDLSILALGPVTAEKIQQGPWKKHILPAPFTYERMISYVQRCL